MTPEVQARRRSAWWGWWVLPVVGFCLGLTGQGRAQEAAPADRNAVNTKVRPGDMLADSPVTFPKQGALPAQYPPDVRVQDEPVEKDYYLFGSPCRSLAQIRQIQAEMPPGRWVLPRADWTQLERTRRILTEGGELRLLALGDSIVNDTMRSGWVALLQEAYPKAKIAATVYVRGGGGCQHYREEGRIARNVLPRRPDLVFIGGISQRSLEDIREVIRQVRAGLPEVEILLASGTFGTADPRDAASLAQAPHSGTGGYGRALAQLAAEERCAYLDMTTPWAEYIRSSGVHPHRFYRDVVHANEYGEQILARTLLAYFTAPAALRRVRADLPDLFMASDTCNVYVLRDGEAALLIDLGDGSVLEGLAGIGVTRIDWVLFTHHHREQCQGAPKLAEWRARGTRVAAPEAERALFETPASFRKLDVRLGDPFTIHGASYVRPPLQPIRLDRTFATNDTLTWRGHELRAVDTRGNSPGSMTYLLRSRDRWLAFSGDAMLDGARMHTWFDTEWDYGFAAGLQALRRSVARLEQLEPALLLPSHGPVVRDPVTQLRAYGAKLAALEPLYLRGYGVEADSNAYQDKVSTPTVVSNVVQVSPHLFKFKRPNFWPNFGLILADSGRALVVDCGLLDERFLDAALAGLREHFGLKAIDAVIVTHMHGDHFLEAPHLRAQWGAQIWALENMVDKLERPARFDYAAPIQAYGKKHPDGTPLSGVRVDRAFAPGESFTWEGYRFTVDWMPGQTEFALCLHGRIDGRHVAFTGDNLFGDPDDPAQTGHEAVVAHNSAILEEGYLYGAEYLKRLNPDLLVGGHSFVMDRPAAFIERYRQWSYRMRDAFQALSGEADYRYWFDPFWVRAEPCRVQLRPGEGADVAVEVRNFHGRPQAHRIEVHAPPGIAVEPGVIEGELTGHARRSFPVRVQAAGGADAGVRIVALDVTLDGHRYGERFDFVVGVAPAAPSVTGP